MSRTASIINSLNFVKQMLLLVQKVDIQLVPCLPPLFLLSLSSCPITYGVWSCGCGGKGPGPMDSYWCLHRGVACCGGVRAVVAMSGLRICICCIVSWPWAGRDQIATNDVTQALFVEGGESGGVSRALWVRMGTLHMG